MFGGARGYCCCQMKVFLAAALPRQSFKQREEPRLRLVLFKRSDLGFKEFGDIDHCTHRSQGNRLALGNREVGGSIVELLGTERLSALELFAKTVVAPGPLKSQGRDQRSHGVVRM